MEAKRWIPESQANEYRNNHDFREVGRDDNGNVVFKSTKIEVILSPMELEVYLLKEYEDQDISEMLGISVKTVASYRKKIHAKGF